MAINTSEFATAGEKFTAVWGEASDYQAGDSIFINGQSAVVLANFGAE